MQPPSDPGYDFYISYPHPQRHRALELAEAIRERGHSVFVYGDSQVPGTNWDEQVQDAMGRCATVLVLVDETTPTRNYQPQEIHRALEWREQSDGPSRVVPIALGDGGNRGLAALADLSRLHAIRWADGLIAKQIAEQLLPQLVWQTPSSPVTHKQTTKAAPKVAPNLGGQSPRKKTAKKTPAPATSSHTSPPQRHELALLDGGQAAAVVISANHALTVADAVQGTETVALLLSTGETVQATVAVRQYDYGYVLLAFAQPVSITPPSLSTTPATVGAKWASPSPHGDGPGVRGVVTAAASMLELEFVALGALEAYPIPGTPLYVDGALAGLVREASGPHGTAISLATIVSDARLQAVLPAAARLHPPLRWISVAGATLPKTPVTLLASHVGLALAEAEVPVGLICGGFKGSDEIVARAFVEHSLRLGRIPHIRVINGGPPVVDFLQRATVIVSQHPWAMEHADRADLVVVLDSASSHALADAGLALGKPVLALPDNPQGRTALVHTVISQQWSTRSIAGLTKDEFDALAAGEPEARRDRQVAALRQALSALPSASPGRDNAKWLRDTPDKDGKNDHLDRRKQAKLFASGIASSQMQAPFAIGLFGDWGAGKSHFMGLMKAEVADASKANGRARRICQIDFNAWHYMDANMWVSIAGRIFSGIAEELKLGTDKDPAVMRHKLRAELTSTAAAQKEANDRKKEAQKKVEALDKKLTELHTQRRTQLNTVKDALRNKKVWRTVAKEVGLDEDTLSKGAARLVGGENQLNYLLTAPEEADNLRAQIRSTASLARTLLSSLRPEGKMQWFIGALLLFIPPVLKAVMDHFGSVDLSAVHTTIAQIIAIVGTVAHKARTHLGQTTELLRYADSVRRQGAAVQDAVLSQLSEEEQKAVQARKDATKQLRQTEQRRDELTNQMHQAQAELAALDAGKLVYDFVEEKTATDGLYRKSEGIVSTVRRDLGELKTLLADWAREHHERDPIDRVVLYIDDLDRCPADRVVQVLQAVHLLLAIDDLFIVVVGVDARWLSRSLEHGYKHLLADEPGARGEPDAPTSEDYLQKIFQVPFTLPRIDDDGFGELIRAHIRVPGELGTSADEPTPEPPAPALDGRDGPPDTAERAESEDASDTDPPAEPSNPTPTSESQDGQHSDHDPAAGGTPTPRPETPTREPEGSSERDRFIVDEWERAFVAERLYPFLRTPRGIKRFINIYRLLRVGVEPGRMASFRRDHRTAEHRVVAVLLATNIGFARLGAAFIHVLAQPPRDGGPTTWAEAVALLEDEGESEDAQALARANSKGDRERLRELLEGLEAVVPQSLDPWRRWAPHVGRYSMFWGTS